MQPTTGCKGVGKLSFSAKYGLKVKKCVQLKYFAVDDRFGINWIRIMINILWLGLSIQLKEWRF